MSLIGAFVLATASETIGIAVIDCYTRSPPVEILVDGQLLPLVVPEQRDDSVGFCGSVTVQRKVLVRIVIRSNGKERSYDLRIRPKTKVVAISAETMIARAMDKPLLLD